MPNIYTVTTPQALNILRSANYRMVAGHLEGTRSLYEVDFRGQSALILGTEDKGLPDIWRDSCDNLVKIPVVGDITDSLNVSVAGAVFMYEALRQTLYSNTRE